MGIREAHKIFVRWGEFLAMSYGKLNLLFPSKIPESFLPYPKEKIMMALRIMEKHFTETKDNHALNLVQETLTLLVMTMVDDETAINDAAKNFSDPKWKEFFLPSFKKFQKTWAEETWRNEI